MRFQLQKFYQQWFLIVISFVISELFIINKLYYMLFLPLSLLIFLLYWQRQFWYIFLVGLGVILHLVITKFSWQPPFHQSGILTGKISYVGNHYYFIKIDLKEYYYSANITLHLGDKINF
ncbi:hypothetical protein [Spiroplasma eriocheiris]|uniref:hypothetical protein n=1 Tax=Spiroplasma eriocheiris TaxID=315358 RepID=UPI00069DDDB2|nr:hypothetical protein [Spiroplasma eriocheiris]AHF57289.1 hypothetical protein SPE_0155 [Spiroplasma eriocheiris CCTCC M 207170]